MSFNLRYDSQSDPISVQETIQNLPDPTRPRACYYDQTGERPWSSRRIAVANEIMFNRVDLIGFQEALTRQIQDLQELLGNDWAYAGVGRDDGFSLGEYSPIFWRKSVLKMEDWGTFWLSETPFAAGSKYPGAGSVRICTVARFKSEAGPLTVMATHWDEQSDTQRQLAASLILHRARFESQRSNCPVILLGDFNSPAYGQDCSAYEIITGARPSVAISQDFLKAFPVPENSRDFKMLDLMGQTPRQYVSGNYATYTGFSHVKNASQFQRIDFIMGGSNGGWKAQSFRVGQSLYDDGMYESDHRPVFADIIISGQA